jgi:tetratricopeptide (TPR) repeat protein
LYIRGQLREAEHWYERMLALDSRVRLMGKPSAPSALQAEKLNGFGRVLLGMGLMERAQTVAEESLHLAQQAEDTSGISEAYATLGLIAQASGRFPEAGSAYAASYAHAARTEQTGLISRALMNLAEIARLQDDIPRMQTLLTEALACAQAAGMKWDIATITTLLGHVALRQQDTALAKSRFRESLLLFRTFGSPTYTAWCLEAEAVALSAEAKSAQAVRLLAAAAALREQAQSPLPPLVRQLADQAIAAAKAALGAQTFAQEWLAGCVLNMEDAIAYALSPVCA